MLYYVCKVREVGGGFISVHSTVDDAHAACCGRWTLAVVADVPECTVVATADGQGCTLHPLSAAARPYGYSYEPCIGEVRS